MHAALHYNLTMQPEPACSTQLLFVLACAVVSAAQ